MFAIVDGRFRAQKCGRESLRWRRDEMFLEVTRPVRGGPTGATASTKLQRPLEMSKFYAKSSERCERVNDEPTPVAGVVIALIEIESRLDRTVDADRVGDSLVLPPSVGLASLGTGWGVTEGTANERLLHHSASTSALQAAVQPWWKTANCVAESNTVLLGS